MHACFLIFVSTTTSLDAHVWRTHMCYLFVHLPLIFCANEPWKRGTAEAWYGALQFNQSQGCRRKGHEGRIIGKTWSPFTIFLVLLSCVFKPSTLLSTTIRVQKGYRGLKDLSALYWIFNIVPKQERALARYFRDICCVMSLESYFQSLVTECTCRTKGTASQKWSQIARFGLVRQRPSVVFSPIFVPLWTLLSLVSKL